MPWATDSLPDVSSDGKSYTFHIRTGIQWSDGTPITAQTFAYSINRALSPCTASPANYYLFGIKDAQAFYSNGQCSSDGVTVHGTIKTLIGDSLVVTDPQTLTIVLAQPAAYFLETLCFPVSYAVPSQLIDKYGKTWTQHLADGQGFGGNMYKVTSWPHDGTLKLTVNEKFWAGTPQAARRSISKSSTRPPTNTKPIRPVRWMLATRRRPFIRRPRRCPTFMRSACSISITWG